MSGSGLSIEAVRAKFQGRLEVEELLGQGAMGAVYRVRRGQELFALKVLLPAMLADESIKARFHLEGQILLKLDHPNIMKVYEVGSHEGWPYLLGELIEGRGLYDRLRDGPVPWDEAFDHVISLLDALAAAHKHQVIHRDIKPSNVLVRRDGVVKLTDFGIAKARTMDIRATGVGIILGTPAYIAPEVVKGDPPTPQSDLFAVGVMLYEMISGRLPWSSENTHELLAMRFTVPPKPVREIVPATPAAIDAVLEAALAIGPENRYPDAIAFKGALQRTRDQLKSEAGKSATGPHRAQTSGLDEGPATGAVRAPPGGGASPASPRSPAPGVEGEGSSPWSPAVAGAVPVSRQGGPGAGGGPSPRSPAVAGARAGAAAARSPAGVAPDREKSHGGFDPTVPVLLLVLVAGVGLVAWGGGSDPEPPASPVASAAPEEPETIPLTPEETAKVERLTSLLRQDPEGPGASEELDELKSGDPEQAAAVLSTVHRQIGGRAQEKVARGFLGLPSAVGIPPLLALLMDNPSAGNPLRAEVAATLLSVVEGSPTAEKVPARAEVLAQACQILKQIRDNGSSEKPDVALALIRLLGWLADPTTGEECLETLAGVPSSTGHPDTATVHWTDEIRRALKRIANDAARTRLQGLPAGGSE